MIEHGDFIRADRQRGRIWKRCAHAHVVGELDNLRTPTFALPLPIEIESFTAMVLIDFVSAISSVIEPE
jgi:hypothetical protein